MDGNNQGRHTERVRHNRDEDSNSDSVCFYNNRHLMYTECDVGGPLRATGGEFGGAARTSLSAIGFDQHNLVVTGSISMTLLNARSDGHSVPVVFAKEEQ